MPFRIPDFKICKNCEYGHCVQYIREQSKKMKDRDTQYRVAQNIIMECAFSNAVPGFSDEFDSRISFEEILDQVVDNAKGAGLFLEKLKPNFFGKAEMPFFLTSQQLGKVRGDVYEMICRAVIWNSCAYTNQKLRKKLSKNWVRVPPQLKAMKRSEPLAVITLGDNYDLKKLLNPEGAEILHNFEERLKSHGTSLAYSTPDLVGIDLTGMPSDVIEIFSREITSLNSENQKTLSTCRALLEGSVKPEAVRFAAGLKTSIRSDRMYQLLFEANAWKFIWRRVFDVRNSKYYSIIGQSYGADPTKLHSLEFHWEAADDFKAAKAVDGLIQIQNPDDLINWFVSAASATAIKT